MPIASKKLYRCPECKKEKSIIQGDAIIKFPTCKKCNSLMEFLEADDRSLFEKITNIDLKNL